MFLRKKARNREMAAKTKRSLLARRPPSRESPQNNPHRLFPKRRRNVRIRPKADSFRKYSLGSAAPPPRLSLSSRSASHVVDSGMDGITGAVGATIDATRTVNHAAIKKNRVRTRQHSNPARRLKRRKAGNLANHAASAGNLAPSAKSVRLHNPSTTKSLPRP